MAARGNTVAQAFSQKLMLETYDRDLTDQLVNRDYQGEINAVGSKLNILNFDRLSEKTYSGANLTADDLTENNSVLTIDQYKSFYWKEKTLDNFLSYIKDPHATIVAQVANERAKNMETFVLNSYDKVAAGNRVGTDATAGTVTIDSSGNVTGSGTAFTAAMVGRGFKATGHTKWYRVKTYASATSIVIEDDLDDVTSTYSGGAINAGATYIVEAATPVAITTSNLLAQVGKLKQKLDSTELTASNNVPDTDRFLIVPPDFEYVLTRASGIVLHVPEVYNNLIQKGFIGMLLGFKVFRSNRLQGDNTNGWRIIGGHPNWMTFAEKVLDARMEEDLIGNFGMAYKDLFVYGKKVTDARRPFAGELYATFS